MEQRLLKRSLKSAFYKKTGTQIFEFFARVSCDTETATTEFRVSSMSLKRQGEEKDKKKEFNEKMIVFHVYSDGHIEEWIPNKKEGIIDEKVKYLYHGNDNKTHEIGIFNIKTIENLYGLSYGGITVGLVDIRELNNYLSDTVYFRLSINTNRYFMNTKTLGSLIGAMLECSFNDFVFNGFSNENGESIGGSNSHKNGFNGDFRYLRIDLSGERVDLRKPDENGDPCGWKGLDEELQNQFNDALYKFGWKSMLSWEYDNDKLLNHCKHFEGHYNHLHVQSYKPKYKKIIK